MNDPEIPPPPFRFAWLWLVLLVLLVFCTGLIVSHFTSNPVFRLVKVWRSKIFLAQAEKAFNQGRYTDAQERSYLCRQMDPNNVDCIRILAHIADKRKDVEAVAYWSIVAASPKANDADYLALAEAALQQNLVPIAERQLGYLISLPSPPPQVYNLAGLLAVSQKKPSVAREWFEKALAADPKYERALINLARLEMFYGEQKGVIEHGLNTLLTIGKRKDAVGLECLRSIAEFGKNHAQDWLYQKQIADLLTNHPLFTIQDKCLLAEWELRSFPKNQKALVRTLMNDVKEGTPHQKREVGAWLNRHGLFLETLELLPLDYKNPEEIILVQVDALAAAQKWQQLSDFLAKNTLDLNPLLLSLFRARVAREMGNPKLFEVCWKQTMRYAERDPKALQYLASYADQMGDYQHTAEAYELMSSIPTHSETALLALIRTYEKLGQTRSVYNVLQRLSTLRPGDPVVTNDLTYLALLLNEPSAEPYAKAKEVYSKNPRVAAFAVTFALAELKTGFPGVGLDVLKSFNQADLTAPGWQAVEAAILAANGQKSRGIAVAERIDYKNLKPEEKALIANLYKGNS